MSTDARPPYRFLPMTAAFASEIAAWKYEGEYSFYNADSDPKDLAELLDPTAWPDRYFAVLDPAECLAGYWTFEREPNGLLVGMGMRPDRTGKGLGEEFARAGVAFARGHFHPAAFRLEVAAFNRRAIAVYTRAGFRPDGTILQSTNGGVFLFLRMTLDDAGEPA